MYNKSQSSSLEEIIKSPKFKRHSQNIEKILSTFDAVSEWADVIGFLTRLSKALSSNSQFKSIPHKFLISKRLAQCLNPALPSGVHQKTLEVYSIIFQSIGSEGLSQDLNLYSYGLFPLLQYSAMNVKPQLLNMYEKYYLPLGKDLKPCMKSLILALLPGFEDEGNEYYEQTYNLMNKLCDIVGKEYFYHCLFLGIISSSSQRLYAFSYILKIFKKPNSAEEMKSIFAGNIVICSRCIAASLVDDDLLVQRSALELLVSYLPVCYEPFSDEDLDIVVASAITVVLRKDMSLNRRLYSWLLGIINENSKPHLSDYIKGSICRSLKKMLLVKEEFQKPYKILLSLLDDSRIGLIIVDELFISILKSVYYHYNNSNIGDELINTVNMFLSMIEPYIIWSNIFHNLEKHHPKDENDYKEIYQLFEFLISFIKITDEEAEIIHLPFCFYLMINKLNEIDDYEECNDNIMVYMKLLLSILNKISKSTFKYTESKINELKTTPVGIYITSNKFNEYSFIKDYYKMQMSNIIDTYNNRLSANNESGLNHQNMLDDNPEYISSIVENATVDHCSYVAHCCLKKSLTIIFNIYEIYTLRCIFKKETMDDILLQQQQQQQQQLSFYNSNDKINIDSPVESQHYKKWKIELYSNLCTLIFEMSENSINPCKLEFVPVETDYIRHFDQTNNEAIYQSYNKYGRKTFGNVISSQSDKSIPNWILLLKESCISINNFQIINSSLLLLFDLISKKSFIIKEIISDYNFVVKVIEKLWNYLSEDCVSYHIQTVKLILEFSTFISSTYTIEKILSVYLNTNENKQENIKKFGVLWRTADTMVNPSTLFSQPLFILFDTLFSNNPQEKQMGEQWFKIYVKDICVCFDPLLQILHSSLITRKGEELEYENSKITNYKYVKEINFDQVNYAFECIITLITSLSQIYVKKLWKTPVKLVSLLNKWDILSKKYNYESSNVTYGEFIALTCLLFIQSETPTSFSEENKTKNDSIQLQSEKLLYIILNFIPREKENIYSQIPVIQEIILRKLLFCIFNEKLQIQVPLLKILNLTVHLSFPKYKEYFNNIDITKFVLKMNERKKMDNKNTSSESNSNSNILSDLNLSLSESNDTSNNSSSKKTKKNESSEVSKIVYDDSVNERMLDLSYIFLHTTLDALSMNSNRSLLLYWIEFILSCVQTLQISFFIYIQPIIQCLCNELEKYLESMKKLEEVFKEQQELSEAEFKIIKKDLYNDYDAQIILYGLERLFKCCLTDNADESDEIAYNFGIKSFSNYVTSIFNTNIDDISVDENSKIKIKEWLFGNLPKLINIFQQTWSIIDDISELSSKQKDLVLTENSFYDNVPISEFLYTGEKYKNMIKRYLNSIYRINYVYVIESLIEIWLLECIENEKSFDVNRKTNSIFQMMKCIDDCSPIAVIQTIISNLRRRRHQKNKMKILKMPELTIIYFWEIYTKQIEDDKVLRDLWQTIISFIKDTLQQGNSNKILFYSLLRLMTTIIERLFKTDMFEDRSLRKDQQDIYQRILDICIAQCQKIFESSSWSNTLNSHDNNNSSTYILCPPTDIERSKFSVQKDEMGYVEIIMYISNVVFPIIRKILVDQEKVISVCNNINYHIISNVFKNRNEETIALVVTLDLIIEMMKLSYTHRCYRKEIWDMFYNGKFFRMNLKISERWKKIMNTIMQSESEKFSDLISRITLGSPTNIFISREQDLMNRALMLRRLGYIIFSGENDQYLKQLPIIQEKIVELLKESNNITNIEVYIFLRVLLRRISTKHLANFWPVIFTELFNLYEKYIDVSMKEDKQYTDEELKLLLSSLKFLELLIVLAPQEFQLHQWIFISETCETISNDNALSNLTKLSLMDKLKLIWLKGQSKDEEEITMKNNDNVNKNEASQTSKKLLITVKQISDKKQINEFVYHISKCIYDSTIQLLPVDNEFIDRVIESDLLDLKEEFHK
ncbi:hypothetical protein BCR36DRAFT_348582 [Piromyces finnis]|uniref:Uncharacterized protein n=1 Tax=Piromyces finnis TaxID=1754191 RepID=A0A1Y1VDL9_9FUNG|nr:hypothetical protein BCR36DRAFT_348582 [Piromyces finnis]|eukprot:ORX53715.1 hypothetical protein BCR36DRAFT_348582 [Piromyces finnis]